LIVAFWADLWSFATAVGTIGLAGATYAIIRQGMQQREEAQKQHQDRFRPICMLVPPGGVDSPNERGDLLRKSDISTDNPFLRAVAIGCLLRNIGVGPALNLRISFKFLDMNGYATEPWELAPLQAGETRGDRAPGFFVPIRLHDRFNETDYGMIEGKLWEIWLEYEDVFGNRFYAVHHKRPVQLERMAPDAEASARAGRHLMSTPPQPWVTFPERANTRR
jgi:hypothetical protein